MKAERLTFESFQTFVERVIENSEQISSKRKYTGVVHPIISRPTLFSMRKKTQDAYKYFKKVWTPRRDHWLGDVDGVVVTDRMLIFDIMEELETIPFGENVIVPIRHRKRLTRKQRDLVNALRSHSGFSHAVFNMSYEPSVDWWFITRLKMAVGMVSVFEYDRMPKDEKFHVEILIRDGEYKNGVIEDSKVFGHVKYFF